MVTMVFVFSGINNRELFYSCVNEKAFPIVREGLFAYGLVTAFREYAHRPYIGF